MLFEILEPMYATTLGRLRRQLASFAGGFVRSLVVPSSYCNPSAQFSGDRETSEVGIKDAV
eukprot:2190732-Lingulodinium_polyedra.AAC.1